MPKKKDSLIIGAVLLISVVLFIVSRVMPKTDLNQKTADVTLAPDAVEYLDATPEASAEPTDSPKATPEPTAVPEETVPAEATAMPTAEASAPVEPTEAPQSANMMGPMPVPQTEEVKGHVIITVGGRQYGDPIPMDRDKNHHHPSGKRRNQQNPHHAGLRRHGVFDLRKSGLHRRGNDYAGQLQRAYSGYMDHLPAQSGDD